MCCYCTILVMYESRWNEAQKCCNNIYIFKAVGFLRWVSEVSAVMIIAREDVFKCVSKYYRSNTSKLTFGIWFCDPTYSTKHNFWQLEMIVRHFMIHNINVTSEKYFQCLHNLKLGEIRLYRADGVKMLFKLGFPSTQKIFTIALLQNTKCKFQIISILNF